MAVNFFKKFRKTYFGDILMTAVMSNLMIFSQPLQQFLQHSSKIVEHHYLPAVMENKVAPFLLENNEQSDAVAPSMSPNVNRQLSFPAIENSGIIGKGSESDIENPADNYFRVEIPTTVDLERFDAVMSYELYGLESASETTKSINGALSYGGKLINTNTKWTSVNEPISASQLKSGNNDIYFNRRDEKQYQYQIKNLRIVLSEKGEAVVKANTTSGKNGMVYVVGTAPAALKTVSISGQEVTVINGIFECLIQEKQGLHGKINLTYASAYGSRELIAPIHSGGDTSTAFVDSPLANPLILFDGQTLSSGTACYEGLTVKQHNKNEILATVAAVTVEGLDFKDIRILNPEAVNVTDGKFPGYRVNRQLITDSIPLKLHLKYDEAKIPEGYTAQDVKTFYFDNNARSWKELAVDSLDTQKKEIVATATNEGTDYINGVIKVPESPETGSFAPTAMSDIKYADPATGVVSIAPPTPNNSGTVNTSFPLKLPQGRNGMTPSLAVTYNSEAGNGWMGIGWNLATQAITLNTTWGAPLYDQSSETEIYSMNGSDLVLLNNGNYTNPHRDANILRAPERIFYERKEGSYNHIIRHGSNPKNYWWEVIDKLGNKTFYGGLPGTGVVNTAVLKTAEGSIGHWAITRSQDPFGNYIEYNYNSIDAILPNTTVTVKKHYLENIKYTKNTGVALQAHYQIDFKRNIYSAGGSEQISRTDVSLNARNGYIQMTDDLLTEVHISLMNAGETNPIIRKYRFDYTELAFKKKQLQKISEYDAGGLLFYSNTIEYFNEIGNQAIISSEQKTWESDENDAIASPLTSLAGSNASIVPNGSPLGTSVSSGKSFGARVGFGLGGQIKNINNTIGASFSYSTNDQETKISFADINGDGLPDKIFQSGSRIYYRHNSGNAFGTKTEIDDLEKLSRTKSKTTGFGFDFNLFGQVGAGKSFSTSKSETDSYFLDYNGDGLTDIISNGFVKFNITSNPNSLQPSFGILVGDTKNKIESGGVSQSVINELRFQTMDELREENPQFDHVKIWTAPYTGTINVTSAARIVAKNNDGVNENRFKLTIEKAPLNQNLEILPQNNVLTLQNVSTSSTPFNIPSLSVSKGDILFFRIHNLNNGYGGEVEWSPKITYTPTDQRPSGQKDDNGKIMNVFDEKEDFILNNGKLLAVNSADGTATINFNLNAADYPANKFSDNIRFVVRRIITNLAIESQPESIYEMSVTYNVLTGLSGGQTFPGIGVTQNANSKVEFEFYTESTSNVDWSKIIWKPTFKGNTTPLVYAPISHRTFDENVNQTANFIAASSLPVPLINNDGNQNLITISHDFFTINHTANLNQITQESFPLKINWVIKESNGLNAKPLHVRTFYIQKNQNTGAYTFLKTLSPAVSLNINTDTDFYKFFRTKNQIKSLKDVTGNSGGYYSTLNIENTVLSYNNPTAIKAELVLGQNSNYPSFVPIILNSPFLAYNPKFYGYSYRNWGQMLYNGGLKYDRNNEGEIVNNTPQIFGNLGIDTSLFDFSSQSQTISDPNYNPENDNSNYTHLRYTLYEQDNASNSYQNPVIIGSKYGFNGANPTASVGRFAEANTHLLYINPLTISQPGAGLFIGLKQRSESKGKAKSGNLGSAQGTDSEAASEVLNQYVDLNGDQYPDIVTKGRIQYTNMRGALASVLPNNFVSGDQSTDRTLGITIPIPPKSTGSSPAKENKTNTNIGSGINVSSGQSSRSRQWVDINGDGLPDKVTIDDSQVKVHLNMGYGFTEEMIWGAGYSNLLSSSRSNVSLGINLSFTASFGAGFGAAASTADINASLFDVNGDQLPDLVIRTNSQYMYYLNNGKGFDTLQRTFYNNNIMERDVTVSGNVYGTFTYGVKFKIFAITFKVVGTPTLGKSADYNEKTATVQDIDGDGLPDVIKKANLLDNSAVNANLNQVGKTHLLKKVNTPLGGSWTVEYKRDGNTYDMPHSKWVMSMVTTHDGFSGDNNLKPDVSHTAIAYENPKYDRRERAFFGYEKVIVKELGDTASGDSFRTMVKQYHNDNYYLNGAEKGSAVYGGDMTTLLSEEKISYNLLTSAGGDTNLANTTSNNFGLSSVTLDKSRLFATIARTESIQYENGASVSAIKDLKRYDATGNLVKYIDYGEGGSDAYKTEINYNSGGVAYGSGFPSRIRVSSNSSNVLMRERISDYYNGKPSRIQTKLNGQDTSTTELEYDNLGNLSTVRNVDNTNDSGDVFYTNIEYESTLITYPTSVSNAFGESSQTWYNLKFGVPRYTTDVNGQSMRTRLDAKGRTVEITGPNELATESNYGNANAPGGTAWTIRMEYGTSPFEAQQSGIVNRSHYAVTRHYDPNPDPDVNAINELLTISIVDGFGQPVQVKKKHISGITTKWMLSPLEKKDAYGRTKVSYQPGVQPSSSFDVSAALGYYYNSSLLINPTLMDYDTKDRVISVSQPDPGPNASSDFGGSATITYGIEAGQMTQLSTNENGQTEKSFTDIRGRNRKTIQNDVITTLFDYNAINELVKVTDNSGALTNYKYDLAGRKTEVQHPDRGVVTFKYDKASRLTEQASSNLLAAGQKINYRYDFGRLTKIEYPDIPQNNVTYKYGNPSDPMATTEKAVGRLLEQKDATGVQVFGYGRLGEVTKNLRSVAVAGYQSYWFYTKWKYDSWNRIREITYPDQEKVTYHYNPAGSLKRVSSTMNINNNGLAIQDIVTSITYNDFGERATMAHGNGTNTVYTYDNRRRLNTLKHNFFNAAVQKKYSYDEISNIKRILTMDPTSSLPGTGKIGGPVTHHYEYDNFNRLTTASGTYTGPNDNTTPYLAHRYELEMEYNTDHTIKTKTQTHWQGAVPSYGATPASEVPVYKNSYKLNYSGYGTAGNMAGSYNYQQPHAVRNIVESPTWTQTLQDDPRIRRKEIDYDLNGNQTEIKEIVGAVKTPLRRNLWDAENRIRAVDLKPDDGRQRPIAIYTYNAGGERTVRYNYDHLETTSNEIGVANTQKNNIMLYPSGLLMGKAILDRSGGRDAADRISYTKHYYVGSERISAKNGTALLLGRFPSTLLASPSEMPNLNAQDIRNQSNETVTNAEKEVTNVHDILDVQAPPMNSIVETDKANFSHTGPLDYYYFHPDHLGSSSYITNLAGNVSQHMEYLPFGETLVDEHLNSRNSPFKYNGKEFDEETGNYYYGARYYDPKWSIFVSVDPLVEKTFDAYGYCYNNPIRFVDPTGMEAQANEHIEVTKNSNGTYKVVGGQANFDKNVYVVDGNGKRTGEIVGEMLTEYSFHNEDGSPVVGTTINLNDQSGQNFFNNEIKNVGLFEYMGNAKGGETLDFKTRNIPQGLTDEDAGQYTYRGMSFNGKIASARDIGNYSAGYVAGTHGMAWGASRFAFDALQTKQEKGAFLTYLLYPLNRVNEGLPTQRAQRAGHNAGYPIFKQQQTEREWKKITNPWPTGPKF